MDPLKKVPPPAKLGKLTVRRVWTIHNITYASFADACMAYPHHDPVDMMRWFGRNLLMEHEPPRAKEGFSCLLENEAYAPPKPKRKKVTRSPARKNVQRLNWHIQGRVYASLAEAEHQSGFSRQMIVSWCGRSNYPQYERRQDCWCTDKQGRPAPPVPPPLTDAEVRAAQAEYVAPEEIIPPTKEECWQERVTRQYRHQSEQRARRESADRLMRLASAEQVVRREAQTVKALQIQSRDAAEDAEREARQNRGQLLTDIREARKREKGLMEGLRRLSDNLTTK